MSSGLQRRRVAGGTNSSANEGNDSSSQNGETSNSNSNSARNGYEDGRRVAYDPDDINNTADELKQPKLTLMEEVLLMGIKDKQVGSTFCVFLRSTLLTILRGIYPSGMIIFHTLCEEVF